MLKKYEIKYIINHLHRYPLFLSEKEVIFMGEKGKDCKIVFGPQTRHETFFEDGPHLLHEGKLIPLSGKNHVEALYEYYLSLNNGERDVFEAACHALCEDIDALEKEKDVSSDIPLRIIGDSAFSAPGIRR